MKTSEFKMLVNFLREANTPIVPTSNNNKVASKEDQIVNAQTLRKELIQLSKDIAEYSQNLNTSELEAILKFMKKIVPAAGKQNTSLGPVIQRNVDNIDRAIEK